MTFVEKMISSAKSKQKTLVLPEGSEPRTVQAAKQILDQGIAKKVYLLGNTTDIQSVADSNNVSLEGVDILNPAESEYLSEYASEYYQLRKHKGISESDAEEQITDNLKWGAMMVRKGQADGMVAGAENATGKVLVAAFTIIKTAPGVDSASSCFVMCHPDKKWGVDGNMIFADCATIIEPDAAQLAEIAIASAESCRIFLEAEPCVSLMSFSTKGSAKHEHVDKVTKALELIKNKRPDLNIDGELQADASLIPGVAAKKAPGSKVAGKANVLIFPDLQSGNIGYKLVERLAGADAFGPVLQGFAKPVSDLSRGCSIEEIVVTSAMTLAQVQN